MSRRFRLAPALATLVSAGLVLMFAAPAAAQQPTVKRESIKPIQDVAGAATFKAYCTVCHGTSGKGDGPAAKALTTPPADLTQIAKRHGGKFPDVAVRMTITGETTLAAHGTREMPMWGPVLRSAEGDSTTALRLRNLIAYLETIQEK
jgi:mono/diheme cytochrome c family protein